MVQPNPSGRQSHPGHHQDECLAPCSAAASAWPCAAFRLLTPAADCVCLPLPLLLLKMGLPVGAVPGRALARCPVWGPVHVVGCCCCCCSCGGSC